VTNAPAAPAEPVVTRLVLVRHGESRAQVDRIVGGPTGCKGLSDLGLRQVEALRRRWERVGFRADALYSSTLPRAFETAEILAPVVGMTAKPDDDLCEWRPGECDGISWDEYVETYNVDVRAHPYTPLSPGGESLAEFLVRASACLHRVTREHAGETVVIACHGGIVEASVRTFLALPTRVSRAFDLHIENTSVTEWEATGGPDDPLRWRLLRFGDVAHLEDLA
jgi:probable phosphoglycerate mutase